MFKLLMWSWWKFIFVLNKIIGQFVKGNANTCKGGNSVRNFCLLSVEICSKRKQFASFYHLGHLKKRLDVLENKQKVTKIVFHWHKKVENQTGLSILPNRSFHWHTVCIHIWTVEISFWSGLTFVSHCLCWSHMPSCRFCHVLACTLILKMWCNYLKIYIFRIVCVCLCINRVWGMQH